MDSKTSRLTSWHDTTEVADSEGELNNISQHVGSQSHQLEYKMEDYVILKELSAQERQHPLMSRIIQACSQKKD